VLRAIFIGSQSLEGYRSLFRDILRMFRCCVSVVYGTAAVSFAVWNVGNNNIGNSNNGDSDTESNNTGDRNFGSNNVGNVNGGLAI
jgi:hypothetical protein